MNYIKHLTGFFDKVMRDDRLNPSHISLYVSLFQFWNVQRFANPISISRDEVMRVSKIGSKATYHKCMKDLHNFNYLAYDPSFNPFRGSLVTLFNLEMPVSKVHKQSRKLSKLVPPSEQVLNTNQTSSKQALVPSINSSNNTNKLNKPNENEHSRKKIDSEFNSDSAIVNSPGAQQRKKVAPKKERAAEGFIRPVLLSVQAYFIENKWPVLEAAKFFNHYQSNGWMVGNVPMQNWQASADKWILNTKNFDNGKTERTTASGGNPQPGNLHATAGGKDYSEPL